MNGIVTLESGHGYMGCRGACDIRFNFVVILLIFSCRTFAVSMSIQIPSTSVPDRSTLNSNNYVYAQIATSENLYATEIT